jgi:hypothetical protein
VNETAANRKSIRSTAFGLMLLTLSATVALLVGCQGSLFNVSGKSIPYNDRLALKTGGEQTGQYKADEFTIDYRYSRTGDQFKISGTVRFSYSMQGNFTTVNTFSLVLLLADGQGTILGQQPLTTAYDQDTRDPVTFEKTTTIPYPTAMMAFNYTGAASGEGGAGSPSAFWHSSSGQ